LAGFFFALLDRDGQALHDRAAWTRVIYEGRDLREPADAQAASS
jgi:uncharacterized RDD family membrane protein YckC